MTNVFAKAAVRLAAAALAPLLLLSCSSQEPDRTGSTVKLCDNQTTTEIPQGRPLTRDDAQRMSNELMRQWLEKNPGRDWVAEEKERHALVPPADNSELVGKNAQGQVYGEVTRRDLQEWARETEKLVVAGSKVFHSGDELGSQIKVSCDMCHPHAANTHPETYPKFQVQMGQTVLLRDMINWCIEHPVRGKVLSADDPKMRALEAYIYAQRKGQPLNYGRR